MAKTTIRSETPPTVPAASGSANYVLSEDAPPYIAGKRREKGEVFALTESEARFELLAGHIQPAINTPSTEA